MSKTAVNRNNPTTRGQVGVALEDVREKWGWGWTLLDNPVRKVDRLLLDTFRLGGPRHPLNGLVVHL